MALEGTHLVKQLTALSSPHRLQIVAVLATGGRRYVSELARIVGMSRPLLYLHLDKLEAAGLVTSELTLSPDGRALKWFTVRDFALTLSPESIAQAMAGLPESKEQAE